MSLTLICSVHSGVSRPEAEKRLRAVVSDDREAAEDLRGVPELGASEGGAHDQKVPPRPVHHPQKNLRPPAPNDLWGEKCLK